MSGPSLAVAGAADRPAGWICTRGWDIGWLIGSAAIVPVVLLLVWKGASGTLINIGVTALIGGPHLFSTYVATYGDPRFRRGHRGLLAAASVLVPAFVVYWTLVDFQVLLSVFIFAASLHVLHQNAYLTDLYRARAGVREPAWSRVVDYGLLMLCIYPIASYKLVHSNFFLGDVEILIPSFLKVPATYWLVWIAFTALLGAWLAKTWAEWRRGTLNRPKTLLIAATTLIAFWVPAAATGERLELAFQSVNAWHSIQYLGIVWLVLHVRRQRGLLGAGLARRISGPGRAAALFYGLCFGLTLAVFGVVLALWKLNPLGATTMQYYYMVVLSCLLIHYVLDGYLFTVANRRDVSAESIPYALATA